MAELVLLALIGEFLGHVDFVGRDTEAFETLFIGNAVKEIFFHLGNGTLSLGLLGPERQGSTLLRSSSRTSVNLMLSLAR